MPDEIYSVETTDEILRLRRKVFVDGDLSLDEQRAILVRLRGDRQRADIASMTSKTAKAEKTKPVNTNDLLAKFMSKAPIEGAAVPLAEPDPTTQTDDPEDTGSAGDDRPAE